MASSSRSPSKLNPNTTLCLACSSSLPPRFVQVIGKPPETSLAFSSEVYLTQCCRRPICPTCLTTNPRLARYNPCLACLGGVRAVGSSRSSEHHAVETVDVNVDGAVLERDFFVIGDEDEDPPDFRAARLGGFETDVPSTPPAYPCQSSVERIATKVDAQGELQQVPPPTPSLPGNDLSQAPGDTHADETSEPIPSKYYLKSGDTITGIALRFGIDVR